MKPRRLQLWQKLLLMAIHLTANENFLGPVETEKHSNKYRFFKDREIPTYNWNSSVAQLPCSIGLRSRSKAIKKAGFAGRRRVLAIIGGIFLMASFFVHLKAHRSNGSCPWSHHAWTSWKNKFP